MFNSRKTRSIAWESAQLSTWVKFMAYDWLSLNPLGDAGSRGRSKNNLRGIMIGIGPIWGITSLTPSSSLVDTQCRVELRRPLSSLSLPVLKTLSMAMTSFSHGYCNYQGDRSFYLISLNIYSISMQSYRSALAKTGS